MQSDDPPTSVPAGPGAPAPSSAQLRSRSPNADPVNRNDSNTYISPSPAPLSALRTSSSALMSAGLDASPTSPTAAPIPSSALLNKLYSTQSVTAAARPRSYTVANRSRPPVMPNLPPPPPPLSSDSSDQTLGGAREKSKSSSQLPLAQPFESMGNAAAGIMSPLSPAVPAAHAPADPRDVQRHHVESTRRSKEGLAVDTASSSNRSLNGEPLKKSASGSKMPVKKSSSLVNVVSADEVSARRGKKAGHEGVTRTWYLYLVLPLIAVLWTGLSVILTGAVAIATNLSNLIYSLHVSPALSLATTLSLLTYLYLILSTTLSLTRTALRLMTWFWTLPSRFGQPPAHPPTAFPHWSLLLTSPHKAIPQAVDVAVDRVTACVWAKISARARGVGAGARPSKRSIEEAGKAESAASMYSSTGEVDNDDEEDDNDQQALIGAQPASQAASKKSRGGADSWCQRYQLRTIIQLVLLLAVAYYKIGIPILIAVSRMGLVNTFSWIAACLSLGSAALIALVNVGRRMFRFASVARQLWAEPDEGKRATMTSAALGLGQGGGVGEAMNRWADWALATVAAVVVVGLTFYRYPESPIHFFVICSLLVLVTCIRLRSFVFRSKPSQLKSPLSAANGSTSDSSLRTMFLLRSIALVVALTCAVVHDLTAPELTFRLGHVQLEKMSQFPNQQPNASNIIVSALLFTVATIGQDTVFVFSNMFTARLSALLLVAFMVMRVVVFVAVLASPDATSLTVLTIAGLLISSLNINTRRASSRDRKPAHGSLHGRVLFNASIVATIVGVWLVSVLGVSNLSIGVQEQFLYFNARWPVLPREMILSKDPLCNYKLHDLKLVELVTLATAPMAAANTSDAAIMEWVNQNAMLRGTVRMEGLIQLGGQDEAAAGVAANALGVQPAATVKDTQHDSHGPFVEFRLTTAPQTSILVVRGTRAFGRAVVHSRILWSTPWFFSASSSFGTLFRLWPDEVATLVVSTVHKSLSIAYMPEVSGIEVVVRMMQEQGRNVVIVGHGFAGTVGQVVGARLGVPAFATAAPGLLYYRHVFELMGSQGLQQWLVNLVPERDAVSTLDKQVGTSLTLTSGCYGDEDKCHNPKELVTYLLDRCYWDEYFHHRDERKGNLWGMQEPPVTMPDPIGNLTAEKSSEVHKTSNMTDPAGTLPQSEMGGLTL